MMKKLNSNKSQQLWKQDCEISYSEIIKWYPMAAKEIVSKYRIQNEVEIEAILLNTNWSKDLAEQIISTPKLLRVLRALTVRDIGSSQFGTFIGYSGSVIEKFEGNKSSKKNVSLDMIEKSKEIILNEIDESLVPWLKEKRNPTAKELEIAKIISTDRIIQRTTSTQLRYMHEPRQLKILRGYLEAKGLKEFTGNIKNPRIDMPNGTFVFNATIEGLTDGQDHINLQVDALIKPYNFGSDELPIFMEAKSLGDTVNPNKRQKEEAIKVQNLRRKWMANDGHLYFILLLGGTVPLRYLQVEASFGLDWVWEHRINDFDTLIS